MYADGCIDISDDEMLFTNAKIYLKRYNQAENHPKAKVLFSLFDMSIICEHVHRLELWKSFK